MASLFIVAGVKQRASANAPTYNRDIRPILSDRCFACHGPDGNAREAELRIDTQDGAHERVIVPGDPDASELVSRIEMDDPDLQMPPAHAKKPPLSAREIKLIRDWIAAGAKYERHWAYIPPQRGTLPNVNDASWPLNEVDRLVLAKIEAASLTPSEEADRLTLVRRLYFDLTGLPPTAEQIDEFARDESPDAYEKLVDRLLASEAYGERMASWWFDLVRYANTVGYHGDQEHHITPYRDYVIKSFNENLPFDQFTIEQLAGDLLPEPTMWQLVASGYNRLLQTTHEGGAQDAEYRAKHLADRVRNLSETWLGASVGCAECHDHKFDPFTQDDFYSLGAFFADVDHHGAFDKVAGNTSPSERPPEMMAWTLPVYREIVKVDEEIAKLEASLTGEIEGGWRQTLKRLTRRRRQRVELEGQFEPTMVTQAIEPRETRILPRGNWLDPSGAVVEPHVPRFMEQLDVEGRRANRLDLARWLVSRDQPLTARVLVNRLWQRFFGVGLSKTLIDIGSQGEWPPNQELLDWLAVDFMENGWDVKRLVRQMVTSRTYRQSSQPRAELEAVDPDNRLAARQTRCRLDAEQIRDNALAISGLLVMQTGGGEISKPYQPAGYYATLNFPTREYEPSTDSSQFRRSVYVHWQRQFIHPWLLAFDAPTREECTAQRAVSNTPSAALVLLNDPCFVEAARALATRALTADAADDRGRLDWAWHEATGRRAGDEELRLLDELLDEHREYFGQHAAEAKSLTEVGMSAKDQNHDPAELAAWTSVCRALLNLDETISRN
jgi:hypothetical protein